MYVSLLALGVVVTAAGFVTIGFGIPINAFSLGNTLIVAGTTAVVGGLILIGLAAVVRQFQRIAQALNAAAHVTRPAEAAEVSHVPPTARLTPAAARAPMPPSQPSPPEAAMPRSPEPRLALEPRFPAAAPSEATGPLGWLRPKGKAGNGEAPVVEVPDEAPLSPPTPSAPSRPAMSPLTNLAEPAFEPRAWSPSRGNAPAETKPASRAEQVARTSQPAERPRDNGLFDVAWPDARSGRPTNGSSEQRHAAPEAPPTRLREEPAVAEKRSEAPSAPGAEPPVAILKSGVIDGMAYTLYADGSIEAELPQGTVRFASIDALRAHLEKHS